MRLIDADALLEEAVPLKGLDRDGIPYAVMAVPLIHVEDTPTIDPVHAAGGCYCRECKHYRKIRIDEMGDFYDGRSGNMVCDLDGFFFRPNDFCSYGERVVE